MNLAGRSRRGRRSPGQRLVARAAFAVPLLLFLILGIVLVGAFSAQWWLLILPVALLAGPLLALRRQSSWEPDDDPSANAWR